MEGEKARYHPLICPTVEEMERGLGDWANRYPDRMTVEVAARTPGGRDILLVEITDRSVPDDNKQVVLFTTPHAATEKNATTSLLRLLKWLTSDDPEAARIRSHQVVALMPCNDPDGYAEDRRIRPVYDSWSWNGIEDPGNRPEAAVLQRVMERYRPEAMVSMHGFSYAEQTMWESTGMAWATALGRSYIPEVPQRMNEAAEGEGFLITMGEQSDGKLLATGPIPGADEHFYLRLSSVTSPVFAYHRFHTLSMTMETGFEESAIARLRRLLQIGNDTWRGERYHGYPVNQVGCWGSMALSAWGRTATERRASRVELWQKAGQLTHGCAHPEPRGTMMAFFSPDPAAWMRITAEPGLDAVAERLGAEGGYDAQAIADFVWRTPAQRAPDRKPLVDQADSPTIETGAVIRLLLPYTDAALTHIRLDGHPLERSDTWGYFVHHNPATVVEVAIPPGKVRPFHVVTCAYETQTTRRAGFLLEDWQ